ncbi:endolytic transglycosylase MltG [Streptomyces sp. AJS327]|uniref:endolytic transglycosylase MltG n=1 Tax=Streptomyces sp. AJS327 TaxID=2545265 RepID=UPI0015E01C6C|nr:endolytic transglycosylase MltG [Streptomyces sp. AJS327]MBA0050810.1 endolytic transglycosylase MltG [Streptomyces sp. AJS327]
MTEYGRGPGSQPWHPDDPLYGDRQWNGEPSGYQQGWATSDPYADQGGQHGGYPDQQYYPQHPHPHHAQQPPHQQQPYGGWDGATGQVAHDPYAAGNVADPYAAGARQAGYQDYREQEFTGYPGQQQGYPGQDQRYAAGQGHPGPGPQGYAERPAPDHGWQDPTGPDPETGWDPGPDRGEHAFFAERDDAGTEGDEDDGGDGENPGRRSGRKRGGKRRGGCACLAVAVVLTGGLGTAGYYGYQFYTERFGPAPDYEGKGSGEVQVEIPQGASQSDMGGALERAGVIKSGRAFVDAAAGNDKALSIHAGTYSLRKGMSASAAIDLMLDPSSQNSLIVAEGLRASKIYSLVDKKLDVPKGSTKKAARTADLGLPAWAKGKPEGLLFPSKYSVGEKSTPRDVLRQMVKRAKSEHARTDLTAKAKAAGKTPGEVIAIASLIQAEAQEDDEFGKVSRVIYNRLKQDMTLGFDSTINYALGRSSLDTSVEDTRLDSPYNTYLHRGLPPGPIANPGHQAIEAALKPTKGDWLYFVTVKPGDTRFSETHAEHERHVRDFNEEQRKKKEQGG